MNKGELFQYQFDVAPCEEGSFLVRVESGLAGTAPLKSYAFSNVHDLIRWLQFHIPPSQQQADLKSRLLGKQEEKGNRPLPLPGSNSLVPVAKPVVKRSYWPVRLT